METQSQCVVTKITFPCIAESSPRSAESAPRLAKSSPQRRLKAEIGGFMIKRLSVIRCRYNMLVRLTSVFKISLLSLPSGYFVEYDIVTYLSRIHTSTSRKTSFADLGWSSKPGVSTKTIVLSRITIEVWRISWSSELRVWFAQFVVCVRESTNYLKFRWLKERFEEIHAWLFPLP